MNKKVIVILFAGIKLCLLANLAFAGTEVGNAVPCKQVQDKEPVEPNTVFPADIGRIYFHTVIHTTEQPTFVIHEWYYRDQMISNVKLDVNFPRTRTWSYKTIQPNMSGNWKVRVIDAKSNLLKESFFKILPVDMQKTITMPEQKLTPDKKRKEQIKEKIKIDAIATPNVYKKYELFLKYGFINNLSSIPMSIRYNFTTSTGETIATYGFGHLDLYTPGFEFGFRNIEHKILLGGSFSYYYGEEQMGRCGAYSSDYRISIIQNARVKVLQLNANAEYLFKVFYLASSLNFTSLRADNIPIIESKENIETINITETTCYSSTFPMISAGFGWRIFSQWNWHPLLELKYGTSFNGRIENFTLLTGFSF